MAGDDRHPGSAVSTTEPSISELFAGARPIVQDLTATLLPGVAWDTVLRKIESCRSGMGFRAIVILEVTAEHLGCPVHHLALLAAARAWMSKHRFPIILDDRHSDRVQLVTGTETVGLNITANVAEIRIKASTRCFLI